MYRSILFVMVLTLSAAPVTAQSGGPPDGPIALDLTATPVAALGDEVPPGGDRGTVVYSNMDLYSTLYYLDAVGTLISVDDYSGVTSEDIELEEFRFVGGVDYPGDYLFFAFYDSSYSYVIGGWVQFPYGGDYIWTIIVSNPTEAVIPSDGFMEVWADWEYWTGGRWYMNADWPTVGTTIYYWPGYTDPYGVWLNHKFELAGSPSAPPNQPPVANAGGPYSGDVGRPIALDASSSDDPDGHIVLYEWRFSDAGPWHEDLGPTPSVTYGSAGTYPLWVRVTDNDAATDIDSTEVHVSYHVWDDYLWNKVYDAGNKVGYTFPTGEEPTILAGDYILYGMGVNSRTLNTVSDAYWGSDPWTGVLFVEYATAPTVTFASAIPDEIKDVLDEYSGNLWKGKYHGVDFSIDWDDDLSVSWTVLGLETTVSSSGDTKSAIGWKDVFNFETSGNMVWAIIQMVTGINEDPEYHQVYKFEALGRTILEIEIGSGSELEINGYCPIDLVVSDPQGRVVQKTGSDIPFAVYTERDRDGDGDEDDQVIISDALAGEYTIAVEAQPDAEPEDTFTLMAILDGETLVLAEDVPVTDIPDQPYVFSVELNEAPTAICQDVMVEADGDCEGAVTPGDVNDGCNDPDGDPIDLSLEPPGPYPLGTTTVTLTVTDDSGASDTCTATVTVADGASTPPAVTCPADVTVECDESTDPANTGTATGIDNCDPDPMIDSSDSVTPASCPQESVITRTWRATDAAGNNSSCDQTITVDDSTAPAITCPVDMTVECDGAGNTAELDAWLDGATADDVCGSATITHDFAGLSDGCGATGSALVTWTATDDCGNSSTCGATFTIEDVTPPALTSSVATGVLWSPDHQLIEVGLATGVSDDCDPTGAGDSLIIQVWSDETEIPGTGDGTGRHAPDAKDIDTGLRLRSERRGPGDGRVYLIIARAEDECGNVGFGYSTVVVPHDQDQESLDQVTAEAAAAVAAVDGAPGATIAEKVAPLAAQGWTQHGVSEELGPHQ